jgi:5-methylcytosine-specific restriction endonuclease McrA
MSKIPLKTRLRSAIRKEWLYSELRQSAMKAARVGYGKYKCQNCGDIFGPKQVDVDHKKQCTPKDVTIEQSPMLFWGKLIENMHYCGQGGVWVLCKEKCHAEKTKLERQVKRKTKRRKR